MVRSVVFFRLRGAIRGAIVDRTKLDDLSKLELSSQPREGSLPDDAHVSAIIKVQQPRLSRWLSPGDCVTSIDGRRPPLPSLEVYSPLNMRRTV
jgi:hypothetical protein